MLVLMNMNEEPTHEQLMRIIAKCDDSMKHVLWVNKQGDVNIKVLKPDASPAFWAINGGEDIQFWVESIPPNESKVGSKGATDRRWITRLFHTLSVNWKKRKTGFAALV